MDLSLNNVTSKIIMDKNAHTATRRGTRKSSAGRDNKTTKKRKNKRIMFLKRYISESSFL